MLPFSLIFYSAVYIPWHIFKQKKEGDGEKEIDRMCIMIESIKDCVAQKIWGRSTHDFVRYYLKVH